MNTVERIKGICKERHIPISKLERDLGFANAYISQLRKGVVPSDRLAKIANYLGVTTQYLIDGETKKAPTTDGEDLADYLQDLRERPETRALLEASRGMTKEQVEQMAAFAKALRGGG